MSRAVAMSLALAGCTSAPTGGIPGADLVVDWGGADRVSASHPDAAIPPLPEPEFLKAFAVMPLLGRGLAVVRLGAAWTALEAPGREKVREALELAIRAAGFARIRFLARNETVHEWVRRESTSWLEDFAAVTERAFEQERQADLVVFIHTPTDIDVRARDRHVRLTFEEFVARADGLTRERRLAVLIRGKRDAGPDVDEGVERALRRAGFAKVVVQQAHSRGRPILRE